MEGGSDDSWPGEQFDDVELEAFHEVELALEWLHRAHGQLVAFHHAVGHGVDHLAEAEVLLREAGHDELADALRDEYLPRGVVDEGTWSYRVVEGFQDGFLADVTAFERTVRDRVAEGERHVAERRLRREWRERAGERD